MILLFLGCLLPPYDPAAPQPTISESRVDVSGIDARGVRVPPREPPHTGPWATECPGVYAYPVDTGVLYDCPPPPEGAVEIEAAMYTIFPYSNGPETSDIFNIYGNISTGWSSRATWASQYGDFARANPGVFVGSLTMQFVAAYPPTFQGEYAYGEGGARYDLHLYGYWPDESAGWLSASPGSAVQQGGYSSLCISRFRKRRVTGAITLYTGTEGYVQIPDTTFYFRFDFFDDTCFEDLANYHSEADLRSTRVNTVFYPTTYTFGITEEKAWSPGYWESRERAAPE